LSVSDDRRQAVLFAFLHSSTLRETQPPIRLRGLDPAATYALRTISGAAAAGTPARASGAYWMGHGLQAALNGDFQAAAFVLEAKA
jgi:alpha-galactosidase